MTISLVVSPTVSENRVGLDREQRSASTSRSYLGRWSRLRSVVVSAISFTVYLSIGVELVVGPQSVNSWVVTAFVGVIFSVLVVFEVIFGPHNVIALAALFTLLLR